MTADKWSDIPVFTKVVVLWSDAFAVGAAQYESPRELVESYKPCLRKTVGFWMGFTQEVVAIATEDDRSPDTPHAAGGPHYIPFGMVKDVKAVSLRRKRVKKVSDTAVPT